MRRSELTVLLPPAELKDNGDIVSRVYPLTITGTVHTPMVIIEDIHISPGNGVLDIRMTGEGVFDRRHTIGVTNTALPQAAATEMQPLEIRLLNLNPDAAVYVVVVVSTVEAFGGSPPVTFGGAVRFRGTLPLGTDGVRPDDISDRAGDKSVIADGPLWKAVLTTNDTFEVRNIRDITSQVRVLSPTGTGRIPVTGGSRRVIIVKKDGVTMEVETESLDFRNIFELDVPVGGSVRILGLIADAIGSEVIQSGAITNAHIESNAVNARTIVNGAVTPAKLDRSYSESGHVHDSRYYTETEVNSLLAGKSNSGHVHDDRYYTESEMNTMLAGKSNTGHNHDARYAAVLHQHDPNAWAASGGAPWAYTHTINKNTSIRIQPGTEHWVLGTYGVTQPVTRFGTVAISSGGITWGYFHHHLAGFGWINLADVTPR